LTPERAVPKRDPVATILQAVGIAGFAGIVAMVSHKMFNDIAMLAERHSGWDFWAALARHILRNLGGGGAG
jgi:hypothetical protein